MKGKARYIEELAGAAATVAAILVFFNTVYAQRNQDTRRITVAFWNLENFFDPFRDSLAKDEEFTSGSIRRWTWKRFTDKAEDLAKSIISMKGRLGEFPVIVGMCEVENGLVLNHLVNKTLLKYTGYGYIHHDSPDERGIDAALIYRRSIFKITEHKAVSVNTGNGRKTRDILYVKGCIGKDTLHILVNHWPSRLGNNSESLARRREAAETLLSICDSITRTCRGSRIIAMGDFNDTFGSEAVSLLSRMFIFPEISVAGTLETEKLVKGSYKYKDRWETIDLIMSSGNIHPEHGEFMVFAPEHLLEKDRKYLGYKPFRTYIGPRYNGGCSDHLPVLCIFNLSD